MYGYDLPWTSALPPLIYFDIGLTTSFCLLWTYYSLVFTVCTCDHSDELFLVRLLS